MKNKFLEWGYELFHRAVVFSSLIVLFAAIVTSAIIFSADASDQPWGSKRQKAIDFDDEVVEGMNKKPLDSVNQISERDKKKRKPHLYRTRAGFRPETAQTLKALRYQP